tara:strand:+ start:141 stop:560 length:420 start_codon:yes stop_codon:yes gene_type:complete
MSVPKANRENHIYKEPEDFRQCKMCKVSLPKENFYKDKSQWDGLENRCIECGVVRTRDVRRNPTKKKCIEYLGGKCEHCGVTLDDIHQSAFDFHHKDPSKKEINISQMRGDLWKNVIKELKKCILLCSNCHRKHHWGAA